MPPLDVAYSVCAVIGGVTDELTVGNDTDLMTDVEVASYTAAQMWPCRHSAYQIGAAFSLL